MADNEPGIEFGQAAAVLRVADISRSIAWYETVLGFEGFPFFESEPYVFAILEKGEARLMLRRHAGFVRDSSFRGCDVYLTLTGGRIREVFAEMSERATIVRPLEHMSYGDCEFEVADPDGNVLCLGELLDDPAGIPDARDE